MIRLLEFFTELIAWLQIVATPLLIGLGIGALVHYMIPNAAGLIIGMSIASIGLIVGLLWATKIWKTTGTIWFISRAMATPELDGTARSVTDAKPSPEDEQKGPSR